MAEQTSKTGVWIDTQTGKVVEKQPEEGVQLVAEGGVITPNVQAAIERASDTVEDDKPAKSSKSKG